MFLASLDVVASSTAGTAPKKTRPTDLIRHLTFYLLNSLNLYTSPTNLNCSLFFPMLSQDMQILNLKDLYRPLHSTYLKLQ